MRFDMMQKRGGFGPEGPVEVFNELGAVTRSSEEKYEWKRRGGWWANLQLVVVRNATGPIPRYYDEAKAETLSSGVMAFPQRTPSPLGPEDDATLFVFPDKTWVRTDGELAKRVRDQLAALGTPPPLPTTDADVAWEICGAMDPNELGLPWDLWTIRGSRVAARLFASKQEGELVYDFDSPARASEALARQEATCRRRRCDWAKAGRAEGSFVRYTVSLKKTPTTKRNDFEIAHTTPMLGSPPPAAPGMPPSGVYQRFVDIHADTCPTRSAGAKFPSMHELVLIEHENGRPFTTVGSVEPRAPGILTQSPMKDVKLEVGHVSRKSTTHLCKSFAIEREMTVLKVTGNIIQVRDVVRHVGSTKGCRHPNLPSNCHHEAITTLVLRRPACAAHCDATYEGPWSTGSNDPAPSVDATCTCPDAPKP